MTADAAAPSCKRRSPRDGSAATPSPPCSMPRDSNARRAPAPPCGLSEREVEVLGLLAHGMTNKQIAGKLYLSARTVQHHVAHIYDKIDRRTRAGAAMFAMEHRLVTA